MMRVLNYGRRHFLVAKEIFLTIFPRIFMTLVCYFQQSLWNVYNVSLVSVLFSGYGD